MSEPSFATCLLDFMQAFGERAIRKPVSMELANKEEALKIIQEVGVGCLTAESEIILGRTQSFLLFGIEFWWRPSIAAVEVQQGLKAVA